MTVWFDGVDITVEVAFTTKPLDEVPSWTDITAYVRSIDTDAGRTSEYSTYSPRRLSLTLSNNDRRFDPEYASSPYVGNLVPMKRIRVRATYSAVTYPLFDGFVLGWPQVVREMIDETIRLDAVDGFRFLENAVLQRSAYEGAVLGISPSYMPDGPMHYWPLQEQNTTASARYEDVVTGMDLAFRRNIFPVTAAPNGSGVDIAAASSTTVPQMVDPVAASAAVADFQWGTTAFTDSAIGNSSTAMVDEPFGLSFWVKPIIDATTNLIDWFIDNDAGCNVQAHVKPGSWTNGFFVNISNGAYVPPPVNATYSPGTVQVRFYNEAGNVGFVDANVAVIDTSVFTHLAFWCDGADLLCYVNGSLVKTIAPTGTADETASGGVGLYRGSYAHLAVYPYGNEPDWQAHYLAGITAWGHPYGERSGARIERVLDEIGWPDALRDLSTGDTVHGPHMPARQSALQYLRQVAAGEDGLLYIAADGKVTLRDRSWQWKQATSGTFSDDGAGLPYSDIVIDANSVDAIRNEVAVSFRSGDGYVSVRDATSVEDYGPSSDPVDANTVDSSTTARALANYRLRTRKDPRTLITELEVKPRTKASTMMPAVLGTDIGDVVTVERTPAGVGSQVVKTLAIQGLAHSINANGEWTVRYYLAPAPTSGADAPYLLVNTSGAQSLIGAASGNLIPF